MEPKRCDACPANKAMWAWRMSLSGDEACPMEDCRQPEQETCAYCPIHMSLRAEYREKVKRCGKSPKMVKCVEDGLVFVSQSQAAQWYGVSQAGVARVVDKPTRSICGMHFVSWSCLKCVNNRSDGA